MLEKIGVGILTKVVPGFLRGVWERVKNRHQNSKNASHDYRNHYKERHGRLKVSCIGMEAPISLENVYVTVRFLDKKRASKYRTLEDIEEAFREGDEEYYLSNSDGRQDGMQVASAKQYLVVLGGPGIGKSTFLRKLGLEVLKEKSENFEHKCIPVFLELKNFKEDQIDIEARITHEFKTCGYPYPEQVTKSKLESGELLVLFDGLDEVRTANVDNVIHKIEDFVDQYSQNRFIISCRVAAYRGRFTRFTEVEIADFDDSQIEKYIKNWFSSAPDQEMETAKRCWETLKAPEHQAIRALAQNPLSLAMLCIIYEESQDFPSNRAILYEGILNIFLKKWTAEKHVHRDSPISSYLDILTVKEMLSEIAAKNFKADCVLLSENELLNQIQEFSQQNTNIPTTFDVSKILDTILVDPGLFVERANGIYSFLHLTFQEYLTANYFVSTRLIQQLVTEHLHDERWREIFLFASELLPEGGSLLIAMEAETTRSINTGGLKALIQWVERITTVSDSLYSELAKRAFAIRQYFFLRILNKIHETVEETDKCQAKQSQNLGLHFEFDLDRNFWQDLQLYEYLYPYLYLDFYRDLYQDLDLDLYLYQDLYRDFHLDCHLELYLDIYRELYRDFVAYLYLDHDQALFLYHDFYRYMDSNFLFSIFSKSGDRFDRELSERIELVERVEQMKVFNQVDLQRMVKRFKTQWVFIKAAGTGKSVELQADSIHETWLSVLGITDEMLSISHKEMENYIRYLRAIELIVACKEAAERVSPDVWQKIEDRFLTVDAAESEN